MGILIGTDEAGYGPNFGPLVVAATAWQVPDEVAPVRVRRLASAARPNRAGTALTESPARLPGLHEVDLYRVLRSVISKSASERRIAVADSKVLYHPGLGLRQLERGIHAVLSAMGQSHARWSALVEYCRADPDGNHRHHCWPDGHDADLPIDAASEELGRLGA